MAKVKYNNVEPILEAHKKINELIEYNYTTREIAVNALNNTNEIIKQQEQMNRRAAGMIPRKRQIRIRF